MLSGKQRYPFRLATTSFIYPVGYADNVEKLAPFVDEIELLLFESDPGDWPSHDEIKRLSELARTLDLTYNVHLPLDVALGDPAQGARERYVALLDRLMGHVAILSATTYTLHLAYTAGECTPEAIAAWQARTAASLSALLARTGLPPRLLSIETLDYPPEWFAPIVENLDLSVCLDVGHLMRYGFALTKAFSDFHNRIAILHLHGVEADRDHRSLAHLPIPARGVVVPFLRGFSGSVSLELFSPDLLRDSLSALSGMMAAADDA